MRECHCLVASIGLLIGVGLRLHSPNLLDFVVLQRSDELYLQLLAMEAERS
jgi:hypothetical protein